MPYCAYKTINLRENSRAIIVKANMIIEEHAEKGFDLTLRQLYYQFVSRGWLDNTERNYKRLGGILSDGRLTGLIDWDRICDRTRHTRISPHWESPADIILSAAQQFAVDKWSDQPTRVEVWIEKDALVGVITGVCERWDVPYMSCRGYISQSELWRDAQRHLAWERGEQQVVVLHLGDHDPSGIDMTRDMQERLQDFAANTTIKRIALTMDQIDELNPPPNPAKVTDARFRTYQNEHGDESWELDALPPEYIVDLVEKNIEEIVDLDKWNDRAEVQERGRKKLQEKAKHLAKEWREK